MEIPMMLLLCNLTIIMGVAIIKVEYVQTSISRLDLFGEMQTQEIIAQHCNMAVLF